MQFPSQRERENASALSYASKHSKILQLKPERNKKTYSIGRLFLPEIIESPPQACHISP